MGGGDGFRWGVSTWGGGGVSSGGGGEYVGVNGYNWVD